MVDKRRIRIKIIHALSSGIILALVASLLLAPSVWQISSQPQTVRTTGGESVDMPKVPPQPQTFTPSQPDMQAALIGIVASAAVVVAVVLSFQLTRRLEEAS